MLWLSLVAGTVWPLTGVSLLAGGFVLVGAVCAIAAARDPRITTEAADGDRWRTGLLALCAVAPSRPESKNIVDAIRARYMATPSFPMAMAPPSAASAAPVLSHPAMVQIVQASENESTSEILSSQNQR